MLQILTTTAQNLKVATLLFAGITASTLNPGFASGTGEDRASATKDAVAYQAAIEDLKSDYADKLAYQIALDELAIDLASRQEDLFETPSKVKVFNGDLELVEEFTSEQQVNISDQDKLMVYNNTTYYIQ